MYVNQYGTYSLPRCGYTRTYTLNFYDSYPYGKKEHCLLIHPNCYAIITLMGYTADNKAMRGSIARFDFYGKPLDKFETEMLVGDFLKLIDPEYAI